MSAWYSLIDATWPAALGWAVGLSVLPTTIVAVMLAAWRVARTPASASAQHNAALTALACAALLAIATPLVLLALAQPAARDGIVAAAPARTGTSPAALEALADRFQNPPRRPAPSVSGPEPRPLMGARAHAIATAAGVMWIAGVTAFATRLAGGWLLTVRLRRRSVPLTSGAAVTAFEHLRQRASVPTLSLAQSREVEAPVVAGVRRPMVILPAQLYESLPNYAIEPLLAHEIAHVQRHDFAANLAQSVVDVLLFHSPAVWWISRRVRETREFCCDDVATRAAGDPARYVEALTVLARLGTVNHLRPTLGASGPRLITRVRRLLEGDHAMTMRPVRLVAATATLVALGAALPVSMHTAADGLSRYLVVSVAAQEPDAIPLGYPRRQQGTSLEIRRVVSTPEHACGVVTLHNAADVDVTRLRMVGIVSFAPGLERQVQVVTSEWIETPVAAGATVEIRPALAEVAGARRDAAGGRVQVHCALLEVVHANRASWRITPNPAATTGEDALGQRWPDLPRALIGETAAWAAARATLCLDEDGHEYSRGAAIAIRNEPGRMARCHEEGYWEEYRESGAAPQAPDRVSADLVQWEMTPPGAARPLRLRSRVNQMARLRLADGTTTWGFAPRRDDKGDLQVAMYDLTSQPHQLVGMRPARDGSDITFVGVDPSVTLRLVSVGR